MGVTGGTQTPDIRMKTAKDPTVDREAAREEESVDGLQHQKMLKIITKGFYSELIKYGISKADIITITTHLLDFAMKGRNNSDEIEYYSDMFKVGDIHDEWSANQRLTLKDVRISLLMSDHCGLVAKWLENPLIRSSFMSPFPESEKNLKKYFASSNRQYFCVSYLEEPVGVIGADNMDARSKKLEMKKFVGNTACQSKGIGKKATFLFLYYIFCILKYDKVYIFSGDTNIRNINLNSKMGFQLEGIYSDEVVVNKEKKDVVRMGLLRSRWVDLFSVPDSMR